jgi:hypothetical protein
LATISTPNVFTPVALPPGRFRLATKPCATGSLMAKTIGIVVVASFAASAAAVLTGVAIKETRRRTRSAISAGRSSYRPSSQLYSILTFWPSAYPACPSPFRNAALFPADASADAPVTKPITGIAGCCACAAAGHRAAPPTKVMNSRRRMGCPIKLSQGPHPITSLAKSCVVHHSENRNVKRREARHEHDLVRISLHPIDRLGMQLALPRPAWAPTGNRARHKCRCNGPARPRRRSPETPTPRRRQRTACRRLASARVPTDVSRRYPDVTRRRNGVNGGEPRDFQLSPGRLASSGRRRPAPGSVADFSAPAPAT